MRYLLILLCLLIQQMVGTPSEAAEARFPFSGFFAYGVSREAITTTDLERTCLIAPAYNDRKGNAYSYRLDLPYFRQTGQFRYRIVDLGYKQSFDKTTNTIVTQPFAVESHYGAVVPRAEFDLVKTYGDFGYTFVSFTDFKMFVRALKSKNEQYGNRQAMVRCQFSEEKYFLRGKSDNTLTQLSREEYEENADLIFDLRPNPKLIEQLLQAKGQLQ